MTMTKLTLAKDSFKVSKDFIPYDKVYREAAKIKDNIMDTYYLPKRLALSADIEKK